MNGVFLTLEHFHEKVKNFIKDENKIEISYERFKVEIAVMIFTKWLEQNETQDLGEKIDTLD